MFDGVFQTTRALLMLQGGILAGAFYWLFFPLRRLFKHSFFLVFILDIFQVLLIGCIFLHFTYISNHLRTDFYCFICFICGFLLHFFNIRYIIKMITCFTHRKDKTDGRTPEEEKGYKQIKKEKP